MEILGQYGANLIRSIREHNYHLDCLYLENRYLYRTAYIFGKYFEGKLRNRGLPGETDDLLSLIFDWQSFYKLYLRLFCINDLVQLIDENVYAIFISYSAYLALFGIATDVDIFSDDIMNAYNRIHFHNSRDDRSIARLAGILNVGDFFNSYYTEFNSSIGNFELKPAENGFPLQTRLNVDLMEMLKGDNTIKSILVVDSLRGYKKKKLEKFKKLRNKTKTSHNTVRPDKPDRTIFLTDERGRQRNVMTATVDNAREYIKKSYPEESFDERFVTMLIHNCLDVLSYDIEHDLEEESQRRTAQLANEAQLIKEIRKILNRGHTRRDATTRRATHSPSRRRSARN